MSHVTIPYLSMYQLLSMGFLPGQTTLLTYYFLYWWRLLAKTKAEPLTVNKAEVLQLFLFEVYMFAESKPNQPTALRQRNQTKDSDKLCHVSTRDE